MDVGFRLVDVFTETPFEGNRLCVVPDTPDALSAEQMRMLALETNFSETTFVTESRADGYRMRIFTPEAELPFAGHPTLGTAFTLASEGRTSPRTIQTTSLGDVPVEVDLERGFAWMTQQRPLLGETFDDRDVVAEAAGLEPRDLAPDLPMQVISTGLAPLLVPVRDEATLRRAERYEPACRRATAASGGECLYLFAIRGDGDVLARMFDASFGVGEDPPPARPLAHWALPRVPRSRRHARGRRRGARGDGGPAEFPASRCSSGRRVVDRPRGRRRADRRGRRVPRADGGLELPADHRRLGHRAGVALVDLDDELLGDPRLERSRARVDRHVVEERRCPRGHGGDALHKRGLAADVRDAEGEARRRAFAHRTLHAFRCGDVEASRVFPANRQSDQDRRRPRWPGAT